MTDRITKRQRSELMSRIRGKHTAPELVVRRLVHGLGYRYRLHVRKLPGTPDLVFASRRKVILVHGCFWHRHNCAMAATPKTRPVFWRQKFEANVLRDRRASRAISRMGWKAMVVWECQTLSTLDQLSRRIQAFLDRKMLRQRRATG
jgi:DNA mismatch endonuclease, patch repair protein